MWSCLFKSFITDVFLYCQRLLKNARVIAKQIVIVLIIQSKSRESDKLLFHFLKWIAYTLSFRRSSAARLTRPSAFFPRWDWMGSFPLTVCDLPLLLCPYTITSPSVRREYLWLLSKTIGWDASLNGRTLVHCPLPNYSTRWTRIRNLNGMKMTQDLILFARLPQRKMWALEKTPSEGQHGL